MVISGASISVDYDIYDNFSTKQIRHARVTIADNPIEGPDELIRADAMELLQMLGLYMKEEVSQGET